MFDVYEDDCKVDITGASIINLSDDKKQTIREHFPNADAVADVYKRQGHEKLGHGIGYKYAHDYPNHYVKQQYLPDEIQGEKFYELSDMGYEKKLKEHMKFIKEHAD